jgi:hypothetical protein
VVLRALITCSVLAAVLMVVRASVRASGDAAPAPFLYTAAKTYEALAWMRGGDRFPVGATIFIRAAKGSRPLVPDFAASADGTVSFDGKRVLFSGKHNAQDRWQVWEMLLAGGELRRVTSGDQDAIRPFYLPDDRVVYARKAHGRFTIEAGDLAGGNALAITYGPANFLPTDVLRDGRILFEAGYPLGSAAEPEIYTVYPDGSGVESYRCDHRDRHHAGRQVGSGDIVFASPAGLSRFTSARAQEVPFAAPKGEYAGDIAELPSGDWLVPWRLDASVPFRLAEWSPGSPTLRQIVEEANANLLQPVVLGERVVPKRFPSGLHDWPGANLLCLNVYTSKYPLVAGSIHSVRFFARDADGNAKLLGTAPVECDGSFFVHVPTEEALQIELVDARGKTLQRESGFFWMRHGEQRVCVGCHAGPETAPENAVPQILLKSTTPADMTGAETSSGGH